MKWNQKVIRMIAMSLSLLLVLTACQVPEGVEVPSGVSIPSDLSDLTSEELEQLESYLEDAETSVESEGTEESAEAGDEGGQTDADMAGQEGTTDAQGLKDGKTDAEVENVDVKSAVTLPSGRDWVKYILDVAEYKRAYKDLQAAFGDDWDAYVDHYLTTGLYEGRDQGKLFDPWAYAEAYPDVKEECGDDANKIIEHYVTFGIKENRPIGTTEGYEDFADKTSREAMVGEAIDRTPSTRLEALKKHADNVLLYGRNVEGSMYPRLIVDGMDPVTKELTIWNKFTLNDKYYNSNLYGQTLLLKMLEGLTWITGEEKYQDAAYDQVRVRYDTPELTDKNGLFYTGPHVLFDVKDGKKKLHMHETKEDQLPVELYNRVNPEGFKKFVAAYWNSHIYDTSCLDMNRHGLFDRDMANGDFWSSEYTNPSPWYITDSAGFFITAMDMIDAAYYLTEVTGEPIYQTWGERLLDKYLSTTDPNTGFFNTQIGRQYVDETDYTDRWLYNFHGADFVDAAGTDYKTLTEDDYLLANDGMNLTRVKFRYMTGAVIQNFVHYYEVTGQQKLYDMIKNYMLAFVRYAYDAENHRLKTPMLTNGTDLNPGEGNGPILVAPRAGYYRKEGGISAEYEMVNKQSLVGLVETTHLLKDEDAAERAEIWEVARSWARSEGLGDIGTAMGENVNVNLQTDVVDTSNTIAAITLYKYTKNQQYYDLAVKLADNIIKAHFDEEAGLFTANKNAPYAKFGNPEMYVVFCVEAMTRGLLDQINLDYALASIEMGHDGMDSEVNEDNVFYARSEVKVKGVDLGADTYGLVLNENPNLAITDVSGHESERAIRQMVALGVMDVDAQGNFAPDNTVTRGELVQMVVDLFGFDNTSVPADFRFTDVTGKPYCEAVVIAENAGILDTNMGATLFDGERIVTREEMASIIVKALQVKVPENNWYVADSLYRIQDADTISGWAKGYADIATNYRLMVDITEDSFSPKLDVTKAMAAEVFQNICRYIELPQLQKLTATIYPLKADRQEITWESSDATILEIDQQGRMYPLQTGSVIVTASTERVTAQIEVIISEKEDWMIKQISLNGEPLENFNANIKEYEKNLYLGTSTIPAVTAVSFSGEPVEVKLPEALPGRVELNVRGCDVNYTIDIDNTLVEYTVNENFNHKIGSLIENIYTDKYNWYAQGRSVQYMPFWKVIPRNWVNPNEEGYGCMWFPYRHELDCPIEANDRLRIATEHAFTFGPDQDDMLIIVEVEFAVKNMSDKLNGFYIYFSELSENGTRSVARFAVVDNEVRRKVNSKTYNKDTIYSIEDGRFYQMRLVIDKKTKKFSYYINGELIEKDVSAFQNTASGFAQIIFGVPHEEKSCNAEMFFDNVKVYELQRSYVESTMAQVPIPTHSPKPTASPNPAWVEFPMNESFDDYEVGTLATATAQDKGYQWTISGSVYPELVKVVAKNTVDANATSTDNCLEIPYDYAAGAGTYMLTLDENLMYKLGAEATDNKSVVLEMDVAIAGEDAKANGYRIYLSQRRGSGGTSSVCRFAVGDQSIARMKTSSVINKLKQYPMSKGEFVHMKVVVNKQTKTFTYYMNGTPIETVVDPFSAVVPNIGTIYFLSQAETAETDSSLYIDNLKMYVEETQPAPTEGPLPTLRPTPLPTIAPTIDPNATPAPTEAPKSYINENYNTKVAGTGVRYTNDAAVYTWAGTTGAKKHIIVASKSEAFTGVDANDMCLKYPFSASEYAGRLVLNSDIPYIGGSNREIIVEMDLAIAGNDIKETGYQISFMNLEGGLIGRFLLTEDRLKRYTAMEEVSETLGADFSKGSFITLKFVIHQGTGNYKYYLGGELIESGLSAIGGDEINGFGRIQIYNQTETLSEGQTTKDVALYMDNLKVYVQESTAEESPAPGVEPTMAPTSEPSVEPGVTPTSEPTAEPTSEPTAAPTEAPTEAPVVEPTAAPTEVPTVTPTETPGSLYVNQNYDSETLDRQLRYTNDASYYTWASNTGSKTAKVANKSDAFAGAETTDMCIKLPFNTAEATCRLQLNTEIGFDANSNNEIVVEMDLGIAGNDIKETGYLISYTNAAGNVIGRFLLTEDGLKRYKDTTTVDETTGVALVKGDFATLKFVINKSTGQYGYYVNGNLIESGLSAISNSDELTINSFGRVYINNNAETLAEGQATKDVALYFDNLKIYEQEATLMATTAPGVAPTAAPTSEPTAEPTSEPTAAPTEAPTEAPVDSYIVNQNYDSLAENTQLRYAEDDTAVCDWVSNTGSKTAFVAYKSGAFTGAEATDMCIKMPFKETMYAGRLTLNTELAFDASSNKEIVIEMDIAIAGEDKKDTGYMVSYMNKAGSVIGRFLLTETGLKRYTSTSTVSETLGADADMTNFTTLKFVVNESTGTYSYYLGGTLIESGLTPLSNSDSLTINSFGRIEIQNVAEALAEGQGTKDVALYFDNLKIYKQEAPAAEPPAPSAEPTMAPTAEPTAAPTEAPVVEPTAAPTPAPSEEPVLPPDESPTATPEAVVN